MSGEKGSPHSLTQDIFTEDCHLLGTVLIAMETTVNNDDSSCSYVAYILTEATDCKQVNV